MHFGLDIRKGHTILHSSFDPPRQRRVVFELLRGHTQRHFCRYGKPNVSDNLCRAEVVDRRNTNHRERNSIQVQRRTQHIWIPVKLSPPKISTEHYNGRRALAIIIGTYQPSKQWLRGQHLKVIARNERIAEWLGASAQELRHVKTQRSRNPGKGLHFGYRKIRRSEVHAESKHRQLGKRFTVVAVINVIGIRKCAVGISRCCAEHSRQSFRRLHRERPQSYGIECSKHGGVYGDSESEREYCNESEAW